ncbi:DNA/RNA nuclease SfsA [Yunchengibacter salinarum]|uniref:DNA/RNA nuclease SfsA n=1 Tax=Yunchengibacter salinarum TaxID=3133399 RepID=UPI0035B5C76F
MEFDTPLQEAVLERRYKRFLADVILPDGSRVTAHCANSGSMLGCAPEGARVWLSANTNPRAKLDWRWELVEVGGALVGINTNRPNAVVAEAIADGTIAPLKGYERLRREVRYGENSRIDILLEDGGRRAYVEVKNVTLAGDGVARFPDAITARGRKHLRELMAMVDAGHRAVMVFLVQRGDCKLFMPASEIDPAYADTLKAAAAHGVEILVYDCAVSERAVRVRRALPHDLGG